ncbi:hypothetical protein V8E36_007785 [Tilletia maclaganii]
MPSPRLLLAWVITSFSTGSAGSSTYAYLAAGTLKLCTLGVTAARQHLTGDELSSEYGKRECYIVVLSNTKSALFDNIFFADAEIISDDDDDDFDDGHSLPDISGRSDKSFRKCSFCDNTFSIDSFAAHERSCIEEWRRARPPVKQEPSDSALGAKVEPEQPHRFSLGSAASDDGLCPCGEPGTYENGLLCDRCSFQLTEVPMPAAELPELPFSPPQAHQGLQAGQDGNVEANGSDQGPSTSISELTELSGTDAGPSHANTGQTSKPVQAPTQSPLKKRPRRR